MIGVSALIIINHKRLRMIVPQPLVIQFALGAGSQLSWLVTYMLYSE